MAGNDGSEERTEFRPMPPKQLPDDALVSPKLLAKLKIFPALPDDALVSDAEAAVVLNISLSTLKKKQPIPRREISEGRHGRRVGDIRAKVRGQPTTP
jgi:hypothetical protein